MHRFILLTILICYNTYAYTESYPEVECLTEAIYFEARGESFAGQASVALVIKNRVYDSRWPNSYCGVVHQDKQFSYYYDGKPEVYRDKDARNLARHIADLVYYGVMIDFTEGAKYYHSVNVTPKWDWSKLEPVMVLDNHIFYRDK